MKPAVSFSPIGGAGQVPGSQVPGRRPLFERLPDSMWLAAVFKAGGVLVRAL